MNVANGVRAAIVVGAVGCAAAWGHHSSAGVDMSVTKTVSGTLKALEWSAPHAGIVVVYKDESGKPTDVSIGTGAPMTIVRQGFKRADFRIGSKVQLSWHPNRSGAPGGELESLKLEDGRMLTGGLAPPGAPGLVAHPGAPPTAQP